MGFKLGPFSVAWPWARKKKQGEKTVHIFFGFFFVVNFCLGTGFLGIPYSFFYSGYMAAIPTLIFVAFVGWINANYLLEVMARAQGILYLNKCEEPISDSDSPDSDHEGKPTSSFLLSNAAQPKFEITTKRKFEISELCEIFVHRYVKYAYLVLLSIYSFMAAWSFSTVAGSAWAVNIPFQNFGGAEKCEQDAFLHNLLPHGGCLYAYYFCLFLFAIIVVTLSMFDLKEQAMVQLVLGLLRFITVGIIVLFCIVRLIQGGDACMEELHITNRTTPVNIGMRFTVFRFDPKGWVLGIPLFTYAFLFHTGISTLTHPIKQKAYLHWLLVAMFLAALLSYAALGVVVPLWFRASIQETCTLNWATYTAPEDSTALQVLSYYIILFPSLDVISAFPLQVHVIVHNLYILITGTDTSEKPKHRFNRFDWFLRLSLRFIIAILPIMAAFGVANLVYVLKYAGLFGFISFLFPFLLQIRSIHVCKRRFAKFSKVHISVSGSHPSICGKKEATDDEDETTSNGKGSISPGLEKEQESLLLAKELDKKERKALYMTPYSNIFSHPLAVWIVGALGVILFLFALSSLFVQPGKMTCDMLLNEGTSFENYY